MLNTGLPKDDSAHRAEEAILRSALKAIHDGDAASEKDERTVAVHLVYSDGEEEQTRVSGRKGDITPNSPIGVVALRLAVGQTETILLQGDLEVTITVTARH